MERELCAQLNTLAASLLSEASGGVEPKEATPAIKGKGKKRATATGKPRPSVLRTLHWHLSALVCSRGSGDNLLSAIVCSSVSWEGRCKGRARLSEQDLHYLRP